MKKFTIILLGLTLALFVHGQENKVLLTIDGKDISEEEFLWMYNKNSSSAEELSSEAYFDTYVEFQLKIRDAEEMGLDTTAAFRKDMADYKDQLIRSYIPQEPGVDMLVREAYERLKSDIKASHILVRLSPGADPKDTLIAYQKISELRKRVTAGEDFEKVAMESSEDPAAKVNGGNLNYFTVLKMLYPIETAAYETSPGSISQPVRTSMGYHIVKVYDLRPALGRIRVAHVYTSTIDIKGEPLDQESQDKAKKKIYAAFDKLQTGMAFGEVVEEFSEEPGADRKDGALPMFGIGQMDAEFEKAAFGLGGPGSISKPFETAFGWHIVQLLEKEPIGSFKKNSEDLERRVISDRRPEYHHYLHLERIKSKYGFASFPEQLETVFSEGDSSLLRGEWTAGDLAANQTTLLTIGSSNLSIRDFSAFIELTQSPNRRARDPRYYMTEMYQQFIEKSLLDHEYNMVAIEHPETNLLLGEYRDGTLLFEISDMKVWSKALSDTAGLNTYFQKHRDQYMWGERYDAYIVTCNQGARVEKVRKKYKKIQSGTFDADILNEKYCDNDTVACIHVSRVLTEKGTYKRIDEMNGAIGPGPIYDSEKTKGFVIINAVLPPEPKDLSEVKGEVVSEYQKHLEEAWLEDIKNKYQVIVH